MTCPVHPQRVAGTDRFLPLSLCWRSCGGRQTLRITITHPDLKRFKAAREAVKKEVRDPADPEKKLEVDRKPSTINRELEWLRAVLLYAVRASRTWTSR